MGWGIDFFNIFPNYKIPRALFTSVIWHRTWVSCFPFKACSIPWETNDMADWSQFPLKLDLLTQLDDKSSSSAWRSITIVFCKILKKCNFWGNYCIVCFKKTCFDCFIFEQKQKWFFPKSSKRSKFDVIIVQHLVQLHIIFQVLASQVSEGLPLVQETISIHDTVFCSI